MVILPLLCQKNSVESQVECQCFAGKFIEKFEDFCFIIVIENLLNCPKNC